MPVDIPSAVSGLVADRSFWEHCAQGASAAVIVGVVLESVAELGPLKALVGLDKNEDRRRLVERLGLILLIVGLIGEFAFGIPIANDTARIEALLTERLNAASARAESAARSANTALTNAGAAMASLSDLSEGERRVHEGLRVDEGHIRQIDSWRAATLSQLKPREITRKQAAKLNEIIRGRVKSVYFWTTCDAESMEYKFELEVALQRAGVKTYMVPANPLGSNKPWCFDHFPVPIGGGLELYGTDNDESSEANILRDALMKSNVGLNAWAVKGLIGFSPSPVGDVPVPSLFVGQRQVPFSRFPELFLPPKLDKKFKTPLWEIKRR